MEDRTIYGDGGSAITVETDGRRVYVTSHGGHGATPGDGMGLVVSNDRDALRELAEELLRLAAPRITP